MKITIYKRLDEDGRGNLCLCNFEAETPPRVGEALNIFLTDNNSASIYVVERVLWYITDKDNKGLLTVDVFCKEVGFSGELKKRRRSFWPPIIES